MYSPHGQTTCNHTEEDTHATYSQAKYEYITHVHIQAMTIRMNNDKGNMLIWQLGWIVIKATCLKMIKIIYKQENWSIKSNDIQQWIYTCEVIRTIMEKTRVIMLSKTRFSINIISISMSQTTIVMKHRKIATSKSSIKIISQPNQHVNVSNEYNNQACIQWYQKLSMCNKEIGTHWSTN